MNISTGNFSSSEIYLSTNLTSQDLVSCLKICVLCFQLLVGLPVHSYVLWLIVTGRGIAFEFLIFNLAVCEIIFSMYSLVNLLLLKYPNLTLLQHVLKGLVMTCRPLFQCLICVERYLAVVHPVTFLKYKHLRYKVICCTAVWIITLIFCLGRMITLTLSEINTYIWVYLILFLLILPVQLFCLVAVLRALKQSGPGERGKKKEEENTMKKRAFHLILITTVTMVIVFLPYMITGFVSVVGEHYVLDGWFMSIFCFILTGFVQPVLYLNKVGKLSCFCSSFKLFETKH